MDEETSSKLQFKPCFGEALSEATTTTAGSAKSAYTPSLCVGGSFGFPNRPSECSTGTCLRPSWDILCFHDKMHHLFGAKAWSVHKMRTSSLPPDAHGDLIRCAWVYRASWTPGNLPIKVYQKITQNISHYDVPTGLDYRKMYRKRQSQVLQVKYTCLSLFVLGIPDPP